MSGERWKTEEAVLVWGIAGASLGMEIAKSLALAGYTRIVGCDISPIAYGHFSKLFESTHVLSGNSLEDSLKAVLARVKPKYVLPGGDQVSRIIGDLDHLFDERDCRTVCNADSVVELATDKYQVMVTLDECGFAVPETRVVNSIEDVSAFPLPAVLKPRFDSGGSRGVHVVSTREELENRVAAILRKRIPYVIQAYISDEHGEFTIGVLSNSDCKVAGSISMQRTFQNMLSVHERADNYLISSGSSQGSFRKNQDIQHQAEAIANALGSRGPLNIQARISGGCLIPFEINPRFSASTFLRALSGVNEVDLYLQHLNSNAEISYPTWHEGLALRSFEQVFIPDYGIPN